MDRKLQIFIELLIIHIKTKTTDTQFHKDLEKAYELAFDSFHFVSEMMQDLWLEDSTTREENWLKSYTLIEELKTLINNEIHTNSEIGFDNRLRTLSERLVDMCGTFKQYKTETEENNEEEIETPKQKNILQRF